ncbi:MAG: glycosyltransferase [Candidatus Hydrogenedentota bacterium]|nr:MAG: glycosyltransferase [Candidatus Hydrogenedentota bacterium]
MNKPRSSPALDDYAPLVGTGTIEELRFFAEHLKGKRLVMVNSTRVGGGVAEMLARLVPLMNELGIECRWEVIHGNPDFFRVTKAWHNAIHGAPVRLSATDVDIYMQTNRKNAETINLDADVVAIHDPQPAALIDLKKNGDARKWVWRCHIDASHPAPGVWDFLSSYVERYDASIFSLPAFAKQLPIPQYLFFPSIDPLTEKNRILTEEEVEAVLERLGIPRDKPYILQVSRYDRLKDPIGVYRAYKIAKETNDIRLVLAGGSATDDPEGAEVLREVREAVGNDPDCHVLELPPDANHEINALQRGATIVLQKSIREGFGLTVTEALWKGKAVVAGAVGGIPAQVLHGVTGLLCHTPEGCAYQIRYLLANPKERERLGKLGMEWVRSEFLVTQNLRRWLLLLHALEYPTERLITR